MDGAPVTAIPSVGSLIAGRYRVGRVLGEGGFGIVIAAREEESGRDVALKLLQAVGHESAERFWREARLASKLESEHVVRVIDSGLHESRPFLVMERLRGETYSELTRDHPLPLSRVADCILQTCEALAHAHAAGIVHRDIKASNLFECRSEDGVRRVKVLDFGVSKVIPGPNELERALTKTAHAGVLGSPPYMSPEHIRDARNVDGRADIWSLGVVAYVLLSTLYPFDGESLPEMFVSILEREHERLRDRGVDVPDAVDDIIARCLAKSREERFADVGELAEAFAPFASPTWRPYGRRVAELVARAPARMSVERPRPTGRPARKDPITRSVPPPTEEPPSETAALDVAPVDIAAIENASTVAQSPLVQAPSLHAPPPVAREAMPIATDEMTEALETEILPTKPRAWTSTPQPEPVPARLVAARSLVPTTARRERMKRRTSPSTVVLAAFALLTSAVVAVKVAARAQPIAPSRPTSSAVSAAAPLVAPSPSPPVIVATPTGIPVAPAPVVTTDPPAVGAQPAGGRKGRHPSPRPQSPSPAAEAAPAAPRATSDSDLLPNPYKK